mmetsp:Transcript_57583/g.154693  ORF Transcript_57583/g.154693 Transcript_57583/m.154693 type:complete len:346 (+) Transcript_57583:1-1038(+)
MQVDEDPVQSAAPAAASGLVAGESSMQVDEDLAQSAASVSASNFLGQVAGGGSASSTQSVAAATAGSEGASDGISAAVEFAAVGGSSSPSAPCVVAFGSSYADWDPRSLPGLSQPSQQCIKRSQRDMVTMQRDPPPGCFAVADPNRSQVVHCLVAGRVETPYEGGMFYFVLACPDNYPFQPPKVILMTGLGRCRLNPNLYRNGKVCLSILNTWEGPSWSPLSNIATSLMDEKPYHNEPGFEEERYPGHVQAYNDVVQHETLQHAVLGMMDDMEVGRLPEPFRATMDDIFATMFESYQEICEEKAHLDGKPFNDPFAWNQGTFKFKELLRELERAKAKVDARLSAS